MTHSFKELAAVLSGDGLGRLRRVERIRRKPDFVADDLLGDDDLELLRLELSETDLCFLCRVETDELVLSDVPEEWRTPHVVNLSDNAPWADAIGMELFSIWQLTTPDGHSNGFQFEFGNIDDSRRIQIDGAASKIRSFAVVRRTV